jgi:hypothetical protein
MATIEDVVLMWNGNAEYSKMGNIETLSKNKVLHNNDVKLDRKIMRGGSSRYYNKQAVIQLSKELSLEDYPFEPWDNRICYAFFFSFSEQTDLPINIRVDFESRILNTPKFCNSVREKFDKEKINGQILDFEQITDSNNFILGAKLGKSSSAKDICDTMKQLIAKTRKEIINAL